MLNFCHTFPFSITPLLLFSRFYTYAGPHPYLVTYNMAPPSFLTSDQLRIVVTVALSHHEAAASSQHKAAAAQHFRVPPRLGRDTAAVRSRESESTREFQAPFAGQADPPAAPLSR